MSHPTPRQRSAQPAPAFWLSSLALSVLVACQLTPELALAQTAPVQVSLPVQPLGEALLQLANRFTTVALNVNNVFDKHYLQAVGSTAGGNSDGEPRSFYLTLRGTY